MANACVVEEVDDRVACQALDLLGERNTDASTCYLRSLKPLPSAPRGLTAAHMRKRLL